jgi:hypothetical protein
MDKIKVSLSRNFGTENLAMTAEISPKEMPELKEFFRKAVLEQYESVMNTAIPESEISAKGSEERAAALKKKSDALEELRKESVRITEEERKVKKLIPKYFK